MGDFDGHNALAVEQIDAAEDPTLHDRDSAPTRPAEVKLAVVLLSALALSQAVLLGGRGMTRVAAVGLAIAGINARIRLLSVLAALIVLNFGAHLAGLEPPFPYRLAHVGELAMSGVAAMAGLAAVAFRWGFSAALAATGSVAVAFVATEAVVRPDRRMDVVRALSQFRGQVSNCHFTKHGTQAWRV